MPSAAIVVGVDGSRAAIAAALWAVDEAVSRDIPLRLVYAIEPRPEPFSAEQAARDLAAADIALRAVFVAVESLTLPVKIEVEIVQDRAAHALVTASRSATVLCVGGLGIGRSTGRHYGSVAAAVSRMASCPVAVIQRHVPVQRGVILAEVDESPEGTLVLETAAAEARLRQCPLRVVAAWRPHFADVHDGPGVDSSSRLLRAHLEKQLTWWRRRYPDLDVEVNSVRGGAVEYIARHMDSIQLLIVGHGWPHGDGQRAGAQAHAALSETRSSVLICGRRSAL